MNPLLFSIIFLFIFVVFGGCASTHLPSGVQSEPQTIVLKRHLIPLRDFSFGPSDIGPILLDANEAVKKGHQNQAWDSDDLPKIGRYLCLCKWALGYRGESTQEVVLIKGKKSTFNGGAIYFSVDPSPQYWLTVLLHEIGHGVFFERGINGSWLNPVSWFRSHEVTIEVHAETAVALFLKRIYCYSGLQPDLAFCFYPLDEMGDPELWAYFIEKKESNSEAKAFVEKLRRVHTYQELKMLSMSRKLPLYAQAWFCQMLLEAHFKDPEAVWVFLHTCDDGRLEQKINQILMLMPADLAVKTFIEQRKALFR